MPTQPELEVITKTRDFILWFLPAIAKMPRPYRFSVGMRLEALLFEVLDNLLEAKYSREKEAPLRKANLCLEKLRHTARLGFELRLITVKQYEFAAVQLEGIGKSAGAWIKSAGGQGKSVRPWPAGRVVEQQPQQPPRG